MIGAVVRGHVILSWSGKFKRPPTRAADGPLVPFLVLEGGPVASSRNTRELEICVHGGLALTVTQDRLLGKVELLQAHGLLLKLRSFHCFLPV